MIGHEKGGLTDVLWDIDMTTCKARNTELYKLSEQELIADVGILLARMRDFDDEQTVAVMAGDVGAKMTGQIFHPNSEFECENPDFAGNPKSTYECLIRPDWRKWLQALRKEYKGWQTMGAVEEVKMSDGTRCAIE